MDLRFFRVGAAYMKDLCISIMTGRRSCCCLHAQCHYLHRSLKASTKLKTELTSKLQGLEDLAATAFAVCSYATFQSCPAAMLCRHINISSQAGKL